MPMATPEELVDEINRLAGVPEEGPDTDWLGIGRNAAQGALEKTVVGSNPVTSWLGRKGMRMLSPEPADEKDALVDEINDLAGVEPDVGAMEQYFGGAVDHVASIIGYPGDVVSTLFKQAGEKLATGSRSKDVDPQAAASTFNPLIPEVPGSAEVAAEVQGYEPEAKDATQALRDAAEAMGLPANVPDTILSRAGASTVTGLLMVGATVGARKPMAGMGAVSAGSSFLKRAGAFLPRQVGRIGEEAVKRPGTMLAEEIGASVGSEAGSEYGGPLGTIAGSFGGARAGSAAVNTLKRPGNLISRLSKTEPDPLIAPSVDPGDTTVAAQAFETHETNKIDTLIKDVMDRNQPVAKARGWFAPIRESFEVQAELDASLRLAQKQAKNVMGRAYAGAIPQTLRADVSSIQDEVTKMQAEWQRAMGADAMPVDEIEEIMALGTHQGTERLRKLHSIRSGILDRIAAGETKRREPLGGPRMRNMRQIASLLDTFIAKNVPDPAAYAAARNTAHRYHAIFSESPIGEALRKNAVGRAVVQPQEMATWLAGRYGAGGAVSDLDTFLKKEAIKGAPEVQKLFEDSLRTAWREAAGGMTASAGAQAAEAFVKKIRPSMTKAVPVYSELRAHTKELATKLQRKADLDKNAAARWLRGARGADKDPLVSVRELFSSHTSLADTHALVKAMKSSPEGLAGFRNMVMGEYLRRNSGSAARLRDELKGPQGKVVKAALTKEQFAEFQQIIDTGARVAEGGSKAGRKAGRALFLIGSKFFGAGFGRWTSKLTGGGTVQQPGILSNAFHNAAESILHEMPPEDMIAAAVMDKRWRRILYAKVPETSDEAAKMARAMRYGIGLMNVAEQELGARMTADLPPEDMELTNEIE